ncbi:hypothetical protein AVEN_159975-1, partial [Araneus ventricosus]
MSSRHESTDYLTVCGPGA